MTVFEEQEWTSKPSEFDVFFRKDEGFYLPSMPWLQPILFLVLIIGGFKILKFVFREE